MRNLLRTFLLCAAAAGLQAAPVVFRVDMSVKTAEGKFDPATDSVDVRGSFNGWSPGFQLADPDGDKIYEGSTEIAPGGISYKFVMVGGGGVVWEGRSDRPATVPAEGLTLPIVYFDDDSVVSVMVPVTFRVDMSVKAAEGVFDPLVNTVDVRGSFNNWSPGTDLEDSDGDLVYTGTTDLLAGDIQYKFVFVKSGAANWETRDNRAANIPAATALDKVYFDDDAVVSVPVTTELKFEVDLNVQIAAGKFNPAADQVWVRGNKVGWGNPPGGFQLTEDPARPGVYMGVLENDLYDPPFVLLTGERFEYKHTIFKPDTAAVTWEDGANKVVIYDGTEPDTNGNGKKEKAVGLTFFNGITFNDVLKADTDVLFQVDMNGASRLNGAPFDPNAEQVFVNGSFVPWWSWGSRPSEFELHDDGLAGDLAAGDGIYSLLLKFSRGSPRKLVYKYGIDSNDNEAGFGDNHERFVNLDVAYSLPVDRFGTMDKEAAPSLGTLTIARGQGPGGAPEITLRWTGGLGVLVQQSAGVANPAWSAVPGSTGVSTITLPATGNAAFFRLARP
jgi:hypothetical protein